MVSVSNEEIYRLQKNLSTLRRVAGWSANDLAEMLDVSRQTIANLENSETLKMTRMQYHAIRRVLELENNAPNKEVLEKSVNVLVDDNQIPDEKKQEVANTINEAARKVGNRTGSRVVAALVVAAVSCILGTLFDND